MLEKIIDIIQDKVIAREFAFPDIILTGAVVAAGLVYMFGDGLYKEFEHYKKTKERTYRKLIKE